MDRIENHYQEILAFNIREHRVDLKISNLYYTLPQSRVAASELGGDTHEGSVTREDIFIEPDIRKKIIKILIWGFPNDTRNTKYVIENHLNGIAILFKKYQKSRDGRHLMSELLNIKSIGISMASKLAYFFDVTIDDCSAVIVDEYVRVGLTLFSDFQELRYRGGKNGYFKMVHEIHQCAIRLNGKGTGKRRVIKAEDIELFLFKTGKRWENYETELIKKLKNKNNKDLFSTWLKEEVDKVLNGNKLP